MKLKCIIFGASRYGYVAHQLLSKTYDVIGFADNDSKKWGNEFCEKKIYNPNDLAGMDNVQIIIASQYYVDINSQLYDMGLRDIKVFYYCGNIQDSVINKEYKLYSITNKKMFEDCIWDKEKILKIRENFSENYERSQRIQKIKLEETDRKKVLFCAYAFPPLGGSGVQRSVKFVKYLRKFGYEPIVLTVGKNNGEYGEDDTLLNEIGDVQVIRIDNTKFIAEALSQKEQQEIFNLYAGIVQNEEWMNDYTEVIKSGKDWSLIPDKKIGWVNECLKQVDGKLDFSEIDIVYTTGDPFSAYILGYYLKQKYKIKWVQDYRDPWGANDFYIDWCQMDASTIKLQQQLEQKLVRESDAIIVVAKALIEDFVEKYGVNKEKLIEITNGYDESDFQDIEETEKRNDKLTLCYNGIIKVDRNPIPLLHCINVLIEQGKIDSNKIEWVFNGTIENKWKNQIDIEDKYKIIKYNGYLDHKDSIKSAMKSDILVLFGAQGKGAEIVYTGKVFEYLRMKIDILAFSSANGVIDKLLQETKTGRNFEYDDYENVEKYILEQYQKWKNGDKKIEADNQKIQKYSRENTTKLLCNIFDLLLEKEK